MTIQFSPQDRMEAAAKCIRVMHETVGCSAKEIKQLLHPKMIDLIVGICEKKQHEQM